jgi:hypothetical protein
MFRGSGENTPMPWQYFHFRLVFISASGRRNERPTNKADCNLIIARLIGKKKREQKQEQKQKQQQEHKGSRREEKTL